ncbi:cytidylate kinase-like family protein [Flexivirga alba]|uniref:Cytidylate kinase-like family protein n=1 Tax=Flexivirga alba TaxID=702742 RepID=A0ABW2AGX1_9MICO
MPGITISSAYGAGGGVVAPRVAERLGFAMLDRAISARVAGELQISLEEAQEGERKLSFADRFFRNLAPLADTISGGAAIAAADGAAAEEFRTEANKIMCESLTDGAVILGRGGAAALQDRTDVLRIRLYGSPEERVKAAVRFGVAGARMRRRRICRMSTRPARSTCSTSMAGTSTTRRSITCNSTRRCSNSTSASP